MPLLGFLSSLANNDDVVCTKEEDKVELWFTVV